MLSKERHQTATGPIVSLLCCSKCYQRSGIKPRQVHFAILGIGFHLDHSVHSAKKAFGQLTQFNQKDPVEAGEAFLQEVQPFRSLPTSRSGKWTLVRMLYATGQREHALEADTIAAELRKEMDMPDFGGTRLEKLCSSDPCDPSSIRPENLVNTVEMYSALKPNEIRLSMSSSMEDHNWQDALCALSRFEPEIAISKNREICRTILTREGMPLRQIALNETSLSPLLERADALALSQHLQTGKGFDTIDEGETKIVQSLATLFALHLLTGDEQVALMTSDRLAGNYTLDCVPALKQPSEASLLVALNGAFEAEKYQAAFGALSLVAHTYETLGKVLEASIAKFLTNENSLVRASVYEIGINTKNDLLRKLHLESSWRASDVPNEKGYESMDGSYLLIEAAKKGECKFEEITQRISPESWYHAITLIGNSATEICLECLDRRLVKAFHDSAILPEPSIEVSMKTHDLVPYSFRSAEERQQVRPDRDPLSIFSDTESNEEHQNRQRRINRLFSNLESTLSEKELQVISEQFDFDVLCEVLVKRPNLSEKWFSMLDQLPLSQLAWFKDMALAVASVAMRTDENNGLSLMERAAGVEAFFSRIYPDGLSMVHKAIWSCAKTSATKKLWNDRLRLCSSDEELALEVLAAERFGDKSFIEQFVSNNLASERPIDNALAISIAGFSVQTDVFAHIFAEKPTGHGFLARVTDSAKKAHERAVWTDHWLEQMWNASAPEDFWLNHNLMARIIDARSDYSSEIFQRTNRWRAFSTLFTRSRSKRVEKWQKERKKKLYGIDKPDYVFLPKKTAEAAH